MSQLRAMCREFRAALAVSAICALIFGLLVTGAPMPAHAFLNAASDGIACDHASRFVAAQATATQKDGAPTRGGSLAHGCPDCCLAAHASAAVLPERTATVARPALERPAPIDYRSGAAPRPESIAWSAANGARAPPAILII